MDPSLQLFLDEFTRRMDRRFDEMGARLDRCFSPLMMTELQDALRVGTITSAPAVASAPVYSTTTAASIDLPSPGTAAGRTSSADEDDSVFPSSAESVAAPRILAARTEAEHTRSFLPTIPINTLLHADPEQPLLLGSSLPYIAPTDQSRLEDGLTSPDPAPLDAGEDVVSSLPRGSESTRLGSIDLCSMVMAGKLESDSRARDAEAERARSFFSTELHAKSSLGTQPHLSGQKLVIPLPNSVEAGIVPTNRSTKCQEGVVDAVAPAKASIVAVAPFNISISVAGLSEVLPICVKVLDGALFTCGGDFPIHCDCNLIDVPRVLGKCCDMAVVQLGLFPSLDWVEQQPWPSPNVQVEFKCDSALIRPSPWPSFLLILDCSMSWVVCWKPPWSLHPRQDIRCVLATALQEFLTSIMVISVGIVVVELIQERVQRKCGSNASRSRNEIVQGAEDWDSLLELHYHFSVFMALVLKQHYFLHSTSWVQSTGLPHMHFCLATGGPQMWPLPWPPDHFILVFLEEFWYPVFCKAVILQFNCLQVTKPLVLFECAYDAEFEPVPWPLFNMVGTCSVMCRFGLLWRPPWYVPVQQEISRLQTSPFGQSWQYGATVFVIPSLLTRLLQSFSDQITFHSGLCCGLNLPNMGLPFHWDPDGAKLFHWLGSKPKLKKGGLSVYNLGSFSVAAHMKCVTHMAAGKNLNSDMLLATKLMKKIMFSKTHQPWDPGGSEHVLCFVQCCFALLRSKLKEGSPSVETGLRGHGSLGGSLAAAWGQAAFQEGGNVRELMGRSPERGHGPHQFRAWSTRGRERSTGGISQYSEDTFIFISLLFFSPKPSRRTRSPTSSTF